MKKNRYFFGNASGLKADIARHRQEEEKLRELISKAKEENRKAYVDTFTNLLNLLLDSKAQLTSQIGKK